MATKKKAESKALKKIAGKDPFPVPKDDLEPSFQELVTASNPPSKASPQIVNEAVSIAIGGEPVRPYVEARDNHHGVGDPSNWGTAAMGMDENAHQAQASAAVANAAGEHAEKRGPRKRYQPWAS